jgi:ATP-dependent DNA ligase
MSGFQQIHPPRAGGKFREELLADPEWWAEEKFDGDRRICQFLPEAARFTGRVISKVNGLLVEKTGNLPHLATARPALVGTVLDGEIVCADPRARSRDVTSIMGSAAPVAIQKQQERGWLQYQVFDCLAFRGSDLRQLPLMARRSAAQIAIEEWGNHHVRLVERTFDKRRLLDEVWARGGEGIILKRRDSLYGDERAWVKVKREETHDVVVMGFAEAKAESTKVDGSVSVTKYAGGVGAIRFGQWAVDPEDGLSALTECGTCSGFDDPTRADMTAHPEKYLGRVLEITCQLREPSGAFRHPRFSRWRDDKDASQCVWGQT